MIALVYWDRFFPIDDGGRIRTWNTAKMIAAHEPVKLISFTHFEDPGLVAGRTQHGNIEVIQLDLASRNFERAYRLSTFLSAYPTLIPRSVKSAVLDHTQDCDIVIINGLRPYGIFSGSGKILIANLFDVDWLTYRFVLRSRNRLLLLHWPIVGRFIFNRTLRSADRVLVPSARDKDILTKTNRSLVAEKIVVLPNCVDIDSFPRPQVRSSPSGENRRPTVVFLGTLNYFPNIDAVHTIVRRIAPAILEADFLIVGKEPRGFHSTSANIHFTGPVENAREYINRADVCICPLRYGEGTRVKILEYLAVGKPVVSTTKGAEGLDVTPGENILLSDDWEEFCSRIRFLLAHPECGQKLGEAGRRLVGEKYHYAVYQNTMATMFVELRQNRKKQSN